MQIFYKAREKVYMCEHARFKNIGNCSKEFVYQKKRKMDHYYNVDLGKDKVFYVFCEMQVEIRFKKN